MARFNGSGMVFSARIYECLDRTVWCEWLSCVTRDPVMVPVVVAVTVGVPIVSWVGNAQSHTMVNGIMIVLFSFFQKNLQGNSLKSHSIYSQNTLRILSRNPTPHQN